MGPLLLSRYVDYLMATKINIYANRTQAKKIITILNFAQFSGKNCHVLH